MTASVLAVPLSDRKAAGGGTDELPAHTPPAPMSKTPVEMEVRPRNLRCRKSTRGSWLGQGVRAAGLQCGLGRNRIGVPSGASANADPGTCDLGIKSPLLYQLSYRPAPRSVGRDPA
jgi:hypothetical protein